jgi:hypothetical protein
MKAILTLLNTSRRVGEQVIAGERLAEDGYVFFQPLA